MKFLFAQENNVEYIRHQYGLAKALTALGHEAVMWNEKQKPAFDIFNEFNPEVFLCSSDNLSRAITKNINGRPHIKSLLRVNIHDSIGELLSNLDVYKAYMIDDVFKNDVEVIKMPVCADAILQPKKYSLPFSADVLFYGENNNITRHYINKLRSRIDCNIKIFGDNPSHPWSGPEYCGTLSIEEYCGLVDKVTINLVIHSRTNKISQQVMDVLQFGGFCLTNLTKPTQKFMEDTDNLVLFSSDYELLDLVEHYLKYPQERVPYIKRGKEWCKEHTYEQSAQQLLEIL